eukprot:jgi/Hompol1/3223/HPOL_006410-RA
MIMEKYRDGYEDDEDDESSEGEPEDENGELVTPDIDAKIMKTLAMLKSKNPQVYDPSVKFFTEEDAEAAEKLWEERKKN